MIHRRIVKARKEHWCEEFHAHYRRIAPGELYQRTTMTPGHDGLGYDQWLTLLKCSRCIEPASPALLQHFQTDHQGRALVAAIHKRKENSQ